MRIEFLAIAQALKLVHATKEALHIGEPMRQQKNLVISGYRAEFD